MKLTKAQLKQIIKEELGEVILETQGYRIEWSLDVFPLPENKGFVATITGVHPDTKKVVITAKAQGKTKQEAKEKAAAIAKQKLIDWQRKAP